MNSSYIPLYSYNIPIALRVNNSKTVFFLYPIANHNIPIMVIHINLYMYILKIYLFGFLVFEFIICLYHPHNLPIALR